MWLLAAGVAVASEGVHVDAVATTSVPLLVGVGARVETPQRIRAELDLGMFPSAYLGVVNDVATSSGWYGEPTAVLLDVAIDGAFVLHPRIGWRPFENNGFMFHGGYILAAAGGGNLSGSEASEVVIEREGSSNFGFEDDASFPVRAGIHMLTFDVGYQLIGWEKLVVNMRLGGAFTVGSTSTVEVDGRFGGAAGEVLGALLDETIQRWIHSPTLALDVGYRFR